MRLTPYRLELLYRMYDGPEFDSVGLRADTLNGHELRACDALVDLGLATFSIGHLRFSASYYRLTPEGRRTLGEMASRGPSQ